MYGYREGVRHMFVCSHQTGLFNKYMKSTDLHSYLNLTDNHRFNEDGNNRAGHHNIVLVYQQPEICGCDDIP